MAGSGRHGDSASSPRRLPRSRYRRLQNEESWCFRRVRCGCVFRRPRLRGLRPPRRLLHPSLSRGMPLPYRIEKQETICFDGSIDDMVLWVRALDRRGRRMLRDRGRERVLRANSLRDSMGSDSSKPW